MRAVRKDWMTATLASSKALWMLELAESLDPAVTNQPRVRLRRRDFGDRI